MISCAFGAIHAEAIHDRRSIHGDASSGIAVSFHELLLAQHELS
jgi:hypothetical protein